MIRGVGIDAVQIARMKKSMARGHFAQRVFSAEERAALALLSEARRTESAAACFAAKEAFLKAAGRGLGGFALCDIAALRRESGAPYYALSGTAAAYLKENGLTAHLSLTHEGGLAIAVALLEEK